MTGYSDVRVYDGSGNLKQVVSRADIARERDKREGWGMIPRNSIDVVQNQAYEVICAWCGTKATRMARRPVKFCSDECGRQSYLDKARRRSAEQRAKDKAVRKLKQNQ